MLKVFIGHHKCGTTWMNAIIGDTCSLTGRSFAIVHNPEQFKHSIVDFVRQQKIDFLSYNCSSVAYLNDLDKITGFHVIRDPRDLIVSSYYSSLYSHPTNKGKFKGVVYRRERLKKASSLEEGLFMEIDHMDHVLQGMFDWDYNQPNILELKMEEFTREPNMQYKIFLDIFQHLEIIDENYCRKIIDENCRQVSTKKLLHLTFSRILNIAHCQRKGSLPCRHYMKKISIPQIMTVFYNNSFQVKTSGRKPGEEDVKNHLRKGVPGDWINHFNEDHKAYFKERYGDILIKLGYEIDSNW